MINPLDFTRVYDVARYQGEIDAEKIAKSGVVAVYAKACEWFWWRSEAYGGPQYQDPQWQRNSRIIPEAGMHLGAYEFYRSKDRKPREQAQWFREVVGDADVSFIVIDVERREIERSLFTGDLHEHVNYVGEEFSMVPWIYSARWFWDPNVNQLDGNGNVIAWHKLPLITAHYNRYVDKPLIPNAWKNFGEREVLWQIASNWMGPGIHRTVDLNLVMNEVRFYELLGAPPLTLLERVEGLEKRVPVLEAFHGVQ